VVGPLKSSPPFCLKGAQTLDNVCSEGLSRVSVPFSLYQLIRKRGPVTDRTVEITFLAPGVEAYVFTFG
jgi:hypothetical protein